jgi:hypothetical protein
MQIPAGGSHVTVEMSPLFFAVLNRSLPVHARVVHDLSVLDPFSVSWAGLSVCLSVFP